MKAASSLETGAAFAAFCVNFQLVLQKNGLRLTEDEDQVYRDIFALYESAMKTYFENFSLAAGLCLSFETRERWQSGVMTVRFGNQNRLVALPEGCRVFFGFAETFFPRFFRSAFDVYQDQMSEDQNLAGVLTELALGVLIAFFMQESAQFLPASSDMRRSTVAH